MVALAVAEVFGVDVVHALRGMRDVTSVAGRYTTVERRGVSIRLLLAKNPAGWLEALDVLRPPPEPVMLAVNAQTPDGKDTSWLWDVDYRRLRGRRIFVGGERRTDLAVRLEADDVDFELVTNIDDAADRVGPRPPRSHRQLHRVPADPHRAGEGGMTGTVRLVWVYPDLLSTYGDRGNLLVLERRARLRGIAARAGVRQFGPAGAPGR